MAGERSEAPGFGPLANYERKQIISLNQRKAAACAFINALAQVNFEGMKALCAVDAVAHFQRSSQSWGVAPRVVGDHAIATLFTAHHGATGERSLWKPGTTRWDHLAVVGEDDTVILVADRTSLTASGQLYENEYVWYFRFDTDGLITEIKEFTDTWYALSLVTPPDEPSSSWRGDPSGDLGASMQGAGPLG